MPQRTIVLNGVSPYPNLGGKPATPPPVLRRIDCLRALLALASKVHPPDRPTPCQSGKTIRSPARTRRLRHLHPKRRNRPGSADCRSPSSLPAPPPLR